ncbi:Ig-like domain-containing protein [Hymenobacter latericus]|uniref:Ig-like domain-containing protein n=1 Tax=Hymenobacter sp. YIM 151858-1 TaxID=2987688 RepID=UPI00222632CE|nr:Ig-like domain-containing protein [Hymenobacter sp. YIM 151858-1]UYZ60127.1 Ig-like domain-containing protein [Hymenobacter sp. YIM 151858-1]
MASIPQYFSYVIWNAPTLTIAGSGAGTLPPWFTFANVGGIYEPSVNRQGHVASKPANATPILNSFAGVKTLVKGQVYEIYAKQAFTTGSELLLTMPDQAPANQAPSVALSLSTTNVTAGQQVTATALASDSDGTVTKVEFYNGSTLLGEDTVSPYAYSWSPAAGAYSITAKVYDDKGGSNTSSPVTLTVNAAVVTPTVTGMSPASGPVGTSVTFTGTGLSQIQSVSFGGAGQITVLVNGAGTQLTAAVPAGASSGNVLLNYPGNSLTAGVFTVTPAAPLPVEYIAFGNSITAGYGLTNQSDRWADQAVTLLSGSGVTLRSVLGYPGQNITYLKARVSDALQPLRDSSKEQWVLIQELTNTTTDGTAAANVYAQLVELQQQVKALGFKVASFTMTPLDTSTPLRNQQAADIAVLQRSNVGSNGSDMVLDIRSSQYFNEAADSNDTRVFNPDKLHIAPDGYKVMAQLVNKALRLTTKTGVVTISEYTLPVIAPPPIPVEDVVWAGFTTGISATGNTLNATTDGGAYSTRAVNLQTSATDSYYEFTIDDIARGDQYVTGFSDHATAASDFGDHQISVHILSGQIRAFGSAKTGNWYNGNNGSGMVPGDKVRITLRKNGSESKVIYSINGTQFDEVALPVISGPLRVDAAFLGAGVLASAKISGPNLVTA